MQNKGIGKTILFYLCSTGIGISGMMGLLSFISWLAIGAFHEYSKYPNLYPSDIFAKLKEFESPFSVICGGICFVFFVTLIVLWFIGLFKRQHKLRSVGISLLFSLAGSAAGYFIMQLLDVLSDTFLG